jgi:hypothetical protein
MRLRRATLAVLALGYHHVQDLDNTRCWPRITVWMTLHPSVEAGGREEGIGLGLLVFLEFSGGFEAS